MAGTALLAAAALSGPYNIWMRVGYVALAATTALAVARAIEPRCLFGPYAMVDPQIWPIWLAEVRENQPVARLVFVNPLKLSEMLIFPLATLVALAWMLFQRAVRHHFSFLAAASIFVIACLTTYVAIRGFHMRFGPECR